MTLIAVSAAFWIAAVILMLCPGVENVPERVMQAEILIVFWQIVGRLARHRPRAADHQAVNIGHLLIALLNFVGA